MHIQLFPTKLGEIVQSIFSTIPAPPVLLKLLHPVDANKTRAKTKQPYTLLCRNERDQLQNYTLAKRRSEYLTSRICAKISTMDYLRSRGNPTVTMEQIEIKNSESGRPYVKIFPTPMYPVPEISLSHSKEYGLAVAAQNYCGVDIQRHEPTLKRVKEKYCTNKEYLLLPKTLQTQDELEKLALLWSAKEAIQKSLSAETMPYFTEIQLRKCKTMSGNNSIFTFSFTSEREKKWPEQLKVVAGTFKNYAIAITAVEGIH